MKHTLVGSLLAGLAAAAGTQAIAQEAVSFGTNWVAQAEHGGFYQSVADGTYAECGLDVTIVPGGPQVNNRALMLAGKIQFHMGGDLLQAFSAVQQNIPVVAVAAIFQKHPQVILAHPGVADSWEDLKNLTLLIGDNGYQSYYQWMIAEHGFTAEQRQPYTFNPAPFLADENTGMQGYLSSEPYLVEKEGGFVPNVFLIADAGYSTYATTIETMADTIEKMTDDKIAYAIGKMKENGIADSGDAVEKGIGVITAQKVEDFYNKMVDAGVVDSGIDWQAAFTTEFAGKGVGMDLKK